jgi:hypothetical protein
MCDLSQRFGIALPQLASHYPSVYLMLLALSSNSMSSKYNPNSPTAFGESRDLILLSDIEATGQVEPSVCKLSKSVLRSLCYFLEDIPGAWENGLFRDGMLLNMNTWMPPMFTSSLESSLYWLWLRMGKSTVLQSILYF